MIDLESLEDASYGFRRDVLEVSKFLACVDIRWGGNVVRELEASAKLTCHPYQQ
jgi:alpha-L-arabinofuranosidase